MIQLASMASTLARVISQLAGNSMSVPAPVVAMPASITGQLFSLLPAVQANPPATAITPRSTGSTRVRYLATGGYRSVSAHASSPRPASR
jgi:hypothetical protein